MRGLVAIVASLCGVACGNIDENSAAMPVDIEGWQNAAILTYDNRDTLSRRDISVELRYQPMRIDRDTVMLRVVTTTPKSKQIAENIELIISHKGDNSQRMIEHATIPYRKDVVWSSRGRYQVAIYPTAAVRGIDGVGIKIENNRE